MKKLFLLIAGLLITFPLLHAAVTVTSGSAQTTVGGTYSGITIGGTSGVAGSLAPSGTGTITANAGYTDTSGTATFATAAQNDALGNNINSTYVSAVSTLSSATSGTLALAGGAGASTPLSIVSLTGSFATSGTYTVNLGSGGGTVFIHTVYRLANLVVKPSSFSTLETITLPAGGSVGYCFDGTNYQRTTTNTTIGGALGPVGLGSGLWLASGTLTGVVSGTGAITNSGTWTATAAGNTLTLGSGTSTIVLQGSGTLQPVALLGTYSSLTGLPTLVTTGSSSVPGLTITVSGTNVILGGSITATVFSGTLPRTQVTLESYGTLSGSSATLVTLSATGSQNFNTVTLASGTAPYTYSVALSDSGVVAGDLYEFNVSVPASSNPTLNFYDSGTGGSPIATLAGNGNAGNTTISFVNTGTSWVGYKKGAALLMNNLSDLTVPATALANIGGAHVQSAFQLVTQTATNSTTYVDSSNCTIPITSTGTYVCQSMEISTNSTTAGLNKTNLNFTGSATQPQIMIFRQFSTDSGANNISLQSTPNAGINYNTSQANFGSNRSMIINRKFQLVVTGTGVLSIQFGMVTASGTADTASLIPGTWLQATKQ